MCRRPLTSSCRMAAKGTAEMLKNAVVSNSKAKHSATIIFLHGLGDTGDGWSYALSEFQQSYVKLICPTAPHMPVTVNRGFNMPSWFDIYGLDKSEKQDEEGIKKAAAKVHELLDYEQASTGVPSERIILGGFSQGGSLAMYSALTYPKRLAGILGMSSWLPMHQELMKTMTEANKETPFLQCHGEADSTVHFKWGEMSSLFIKSFNTTTYEFRSYPNLTHSSCPEEMDHVRQWMEKVLPPSGGNM